jgi:hypothetical protein
LIHSYGLETVLSFIEKNNKSADPILIENIICYGSPVTHWVAKKLSQNNFLSNFRGNVYFFYSNKDMTQVLDVTESWGGLYRIRHTLPITMIKIPEKNKVFNINLVGQEVWNQAGGRNLHNDYDRVLFDQNVINKAIEEGMKPTSGNYYIASFKNLVFQIDTKENKKKYFRWNYSCLFDRFILPILILSFFDYIAYKKGWTKKSYFKEIFSAHSSIKN